MTAITLTPDEILERIEALPASQRPEAWALVASEECTAEVEPHVEYQADPIGWAVDKLGVRRETLEWSLLSAYSGSLSRQHGASDPGSGHARSPETRENTSTLPDRVPISRHHSDSKGDSVTTHYVWDGDPDPLAVLFRAVSDWKDVGIESGTGTGKSYGVAVLVLWFLACWENAQVYTFAPVEKQLKLFIWKNITELWPRFHALFPSAEISDLTIRMRGGIDENWAAHGYAVGIRADETVATRASGMHAEHMLLIYEETPGIPAQVMAAGENTCTAPHNLRVAIGNPNHRLDSLHKFCTSAGVVHIRMSALDHPNVVTANPSFIAGAVSQASIDKRLAQYGATSPVYQSRVRGVSPEQASDALIRLEWLEASAKRYETKVHAGWKSRRPNALGVDVANSEHGDRACIAEGEDNTLTTLEAFQCPDANALGRQVNLRMEAAKMLPIRVAVDATGVGAGTVNELHRLGKRAIQALHAGGLPIARAERAPDGGRTDWLPDANLFKNLRSQLWWQLREDFRLGRIDHAKDDELWEELTCPTFVDEPKTVVEAKDEMRDRLGRSPDKADAVILWNWARPRKLVELSEPHVGEMGAKDPSVLYKTVDGQPPRWIGPEGDLSRQRESGYESELPTGI